MDDELQQNIDETLSESPIQDNQAMSTFSVGGNRYAPVEQTDVPFERGIVTNQESKEYYGGGIALPGTEYKTERLPSDGYQGNPLFFKPDYQEVAPFNVMTDNGLVQSTTIDPDKFKWVLAMAQDGFADDNYIGYKQVPNIGNVSAWSHAVDRLKGFAVNAIPYMAQGAVNLSFTEMKPAGRIFDAVYHVAKGLSEGGADNAIFDTVEALSKDGKDPFVSGLNAMQDIINDSIDGWTKQTYEYFDADIQDNSFWGQFGRGIGSGVGSFAVALLSRNPTVAFTLLNFAGENTMRRQALDAGVSADLAEMYAVAGASAMSLLDVFQLEALISGVGLTANASRNYLTSLGKSGLYKFGKHAEREAVATVAEGATEMAQEAIEGAFDPDFINNMGDRLAIAGLSAVAIKAAALPISVRHAKLEDQMKLAEAAGVATEYKELRLTLKELVDGWAKQGKIRDADRNAIIESIIRETPDQVIRDIRAGVIGQLDKVPAKTRAEFANMLANTKPDTFVKQEFDKLDANIDAAFAKPGVPSFMDNNQKQAVRGLIHGVATLVSISKGKKPSELKIPNFVVSHGGSYYNKANNTVGIGDAWSNTEFTKIRENPDAPYNHLIKKGFKPAAELSDQFSSLIHEMAHWVDYAVGEPGFGNYLAYYYGSISKVFGNKIASEVKQKAKDFGSRRGRSADYNGSGYEDTENTSEYMAQAITRIGKEAQNYFGLGKSKAHKFLSYTNLLLQQTSAWRTGGGVTHHKRIIEKYQQMLKSATASNMKALDDMIQVYGSDTIKQAVKDFMKEDGTRTLNEYLIEKDMLSDLYDVLNSFADAAGLEKINDLFDGTEGPSSFVDKGQYYFETGYDAAVEDIKKRREDKAARAIEKEAKKNGTQTTVEGKPYNPVKKPIEDSADSEKISVTQMAYDSIKQSMKDATDATPDYTNTVNGRSLAQDQALADNGLLARVKIIPNKIVKWAINSPWGWGIDRCINTIFGREFSTKMDLAGRYTDKNYYLSQYWDSFLNKLRPIIAKGSKSNQALAYNFKKINNQLGLDRVTNVEIINAVDPSIRTVRNITGWEAMYVYLMDRQGFGKRIQKSLGTDIKSIIASLSEEEKQLGNIMSEVLTDVFVDYIKNKKFEDTKDDAAIKQYLREHKVYNYFPILSAKHAFFNDVNVDSFRERENTDDAIEIADAGRLFSKELSRYASGKSGYYQTLQRIRDVVQYKGAEDTQKSFVQYNPEEDGKLVKGSASIASKIISVFGRKGYDKLVASIDQQLSDPRESMIDAMSNSTFMSIANNIIKNNLAFKFLSLPKNLTNISMFWSGAKDQGRYWNGFAEGWANASHTWKYMMDHSHELKVRYNSSGIDEHLDQRKIGGSTAPLLKGASKMFAKVNWNNADVTGNMAKMSAALDMMGDFGLKLFMLNGDAVANVFGGYGLIKDYMAQGMTEEEAFRKLDRFVIEHQSSSNMAMKAPIQIQMSDSFFGQILAYVTESAVKGASIFGDFDEVKMGTKKKSEAIANLMAVGSSLVLYSFIASGAWDLWDDDEETRKAALASLEGSLVDQVMGLSVAGGSIISSFVQRMFGLPGGRNGLSSPVTDFFMGAIDDIADADIEGIITKSMEALGVFIGANAVFNSIRGASYMASDDEDVRELGRMLLVGRTPGYAKSRTGINLDVEKEE